MKRDITYIIIIIWLIILLEASNKIFSIEYQKGYNNRQAEITKYIEGLEIKCKARDIDERHYYVVISNKILNKKQTPDNPLPGISYHCTYIDYLQSTPKLNN